MKFGFIKVAAAIPHVKVGDCRFNLQQIKKLFLQAAKAGAEVVVFPELSVTGYTCGDLFGQTLLLDQAETALSALLKQTGTCTALGVVGMPVRAGNLLYNCAVVFQKGKILAVVPKSFLPTQGAFCERRWFAAGSQNTRDEILLAGQRVLFGTDLLFSCQEVQMAVEIGHDLHTPIPPSSWAAVSGANLILNLSAEYESVEKGQALQEKVLHQSAQCCVGYVYASAGGGESSTDVVFAGRAWVAEDGLLLAAAQKFALREQLIFSEIDVEKLQSLRRTRSAFVDGVAERAYRSVAFELPPTPQFSLTRAVQPHPFISSKENLKERCEEILSIQTHALGQRLTHTHSEKAVLGISGGLDSTLALLAVVKTFDALGLDRRDIIGVTMPCFGTTRRTYKNALKLMRCLGVTSQEINIKKSCQQHLKDLGHDLSVHDVTYENAQARERTQVLMDLANQQNALVIGTGDLSELALGWATYNGDHMSMYSLNGGIAKTLVRQLVDYVAQSSQEKELTAVLRDILQTPVSPELLPPASEKMTQKTEDLVGPYELHDFYLYHFLRFGFSPAKIFFLCQQAFGKKYKKAEMKKWLLVFLKRFFTQQFKRSCLPDGPQIDGVGLSPRGAWKMPSDAQVSLWLRECEKL